MEQVLTSFFLRSAAAAAWDRRLSSPACGRCLVDVCCCCCCLAERRCVDVRGWPGDDDVDGPRVWPPERVDGLEQIAPIWCAAIVFDSEETELGALIVAVKFY